MTCQHPPSYLMRMPDGLTQCIGCETYFDHQGQPLDLQAQNKPKKKRKFRRPSGEEDD